MSLIDFQPQRILIIRLSAIGDIIMASALIPALREAYPQAHLAWLAESGYAELLQDNPRLDQVFLWPRRRWRQLRQARQYGQVWREFRALARELRAGDFDLVLDIQGLLKSGAWAFLSRGRTRIGLGSREGSQWLMSKTLDRTRPTPRIGGEYLKLAQALGAAPERFPMDIPTTAAARQQAEALLAKAKVERPLAVLCPFTTRPQKHWFEDRWAQLARRLAEEKGFAVAILGGPGERAQAQAIAAAAPQLINWVGETSLLQCAALIAKAGLLIGVDTGLTHLGIAMNTPSLALFGATRPYLDAGTERAQVLYEALPCSPCKRHPTCGGAFDCMKQYTVDKVLAAASQLLEKSI
jgi:heptosyltransferase-1